MEDEELFTRQVVHTGLLVHMLNMAVGVVAEIRAVAYPSQGEVQLTEVVAVVAEAF